VEEVGVEVEDPVPVADALEEETPPVEEEVETDAEETGYPPRA